MDTIKVRKANRIIRVTENELDKYLASGYQIIEKRQPPKTEVVDNSIPETPKTVKQEIKPATTRRRKSTK